MKKVLSCFSKKSSNGNNAALPISANTPPCKNQVASRLFLAVLLMLAAVQGVWATVPTLEDLDFGTPIVDENFNSLSETSSTATADYNTDLGPSYPYGVFNRIHNPNKTDANTYKITNNNSTTGFSSNCLALEQGSGNVNTYIQGKTFGSVGVWRIKTSKSASNFYCGLYSEMDNTGNGSGKSRVFIRILNGDKQIHIHTGSSWNLIYTVKDSDPDIIDICLIYNKNSRDTTYCKEDINLVTTLSSYSAHAYINGSAVLNAAGDAPKEFTISNTAFTSSAVFKVTGVSNGSKAYIDDVQIYDGLPTKACTKQNITRAGSPAGTVTGGTFSTDVSSACENETVTLTATPTGGYDFTSWTITKTADGSDITSYVTLSGQTSPATFTMPAYGVTVNATFTPSGYAITLDKNGGTSNGSAVAAENATAFTSGFTPPSRTGYDLLGYYLEAEGTNIVAAVNGDFTASVEGWTNGSSQFTRNATGTLYAKWSAKTSTVTLDNQSATTAGEDEVTATYDAAMRSIAEDLPTKTGHTFQGYFDDLNGEGTQYYNSDGSSANNWDKEDDAVTLYAYWTPNITIITFEHQGTTSSGTTVANAVYGQAPPAITLPEQDGYAFHEYRTESGKKDGYQIVKDNGNWVNVSGYIEDGKWVYTTASTVSLYAQWDPVYKVDWKVDDVVYYEDNIVTGNKLASFPTPPSSLHESSDKEFAGWRTSVIDGCTDTDDALIDIYGLPAVTSDRTYYAVFGNQTDGSVDKETVFYSEDFSSYENYNVPSGSSNSTNNNGRVVYNDGNVTYSCTDGEQTTQIYNNGEVSYIVIGGKGGKFVISNLTKEDATGLLVTYKKKYNAKVYINYTDNEDESKELMVGGGINIAAEGVYSFIVDCRDFKSATTYSITFESTVSYGLWIDDIELKVYRPEMEKFVTNSYHSDLSSDEESPEAMNWSSAAWAKGVVPTINDTVVLSNVAMTVDDDDAKAKKIILKNNATLTISPNMALRVDGKITKEDGTATTAEDLRISSGSSGNGTLIFENNGNAATVEMYSPALSTGTNPTWQYIGTPFTGSIALYNYYGGYLSKWGTGGWNDVSGSDEMDPFVGYCISYPSAGHIFEMTGDLVSTSATKEITVAAGKNNVVANSWTAPIQIAQLDDAFDGVPAKVYLFNTGYDADGTGGSDDKDRYAPGTYVTIPINDAEEVGVTKISSLQGFYLKNTNGTDGTFTLNYANHVVPDGEENIQNGAMHAPKRAEEENKPIVAKILASGSRYDALLVLLERSDFSYGYDDGWDGDLMGNNTAAPRIYTRSESGTRDIVSAVPDFEGMKIYFRAGTDDSEYTFHFTYDEEAEPLYLEDTDTEKVTRVVTDNSYTFQTTDNLAYGRFILTRTPSYMPTGIGGAEIDEDTGPRKFLSGDQIYIIRAGVVYDATGRKINENTNHLTEEAL